MDWMTQLWDWVLPLWKGASTDARLGALVTIGALLVGTLVVPFIVYVYKRLTGDRNPQSSTGNVTLSEGSLRLSFSDIASNLLRRLVSSEVSSRRGFVFSIRSCSNL